MKGSRIRALGRRWMLMAAMVCALVLQMPAQQGAWQSRILTNGLQVNYCQDSTRQLLHLGITLKGGASLNAAGSKGLSKMYEQLFFQNLPDGRSTNLASDDGIFLSHKTLLESQFFGMSVPPQKLDVALYLLQHGLSATEWSDSSLDVARQAIANELQARDNAPEQQLATELTLTLWDAFASNKMAIERYADILRLGTAGILAGISPYRHPANCLLTATGPDDPTVFWESVQVHLGAWSPESAGANLPKIDFPALPRSIYFPTINEFAVQPLIMMAWPVPATAPPVELSRDAALFCAVLQLQQDRMHTQLVDSGLALDYHWSWAGGINPGQLLLYVIPRKDRFVDCIHAVQAEISLLSTENRFSQAELVSATRQLRLQAAKTKDQSIARLMEQGQSWMLASEEGTALPEPSLAGLRSFAKAYFLDKPHVAGLLLNSELLASIGSKDLFIPPPTITPTVVAVDSAPVARPLKSIDPAELRSLRLYFQADQITLEPNAAPILDTIAAMLRDQPGKRIYLNSFSEGIGDGVKNYQLSVTRAKSLRAWLTDNFSIPIQQVVIRAYGEAFPEYPDENDLRNRRVSFEYAPADAQDNVF